MIARIGRDGKLYDMTTNQEICVIYDPETTKEPSRRSIEQELDEKIMELDEKIMGLNNVFNRIH